LFPAERIVCLTEETVETLYLLGEEGRIVGISGYVVRPPRARREKPRISAFTSADIDKICALKPDLVLAFSDLQADIVADLLRRGLAVHAFNHRDVQGIMDMIRMVGVFAGASAKAERLVETLSANLARIASEAQLLPVRPRVYFEEWDAPMISGIGWVSELIAVAGGEDVFPEKATCQAAKDRIVSAAEVIAARPDIIIGSWCGKKFRPEKLVARPGFEHIPAVRHHQVHEVKSPLILQPGPAALTDGIAALWEIIRQWSRDPSEC